MTRYAGLMKSSPVPQTQPLNERQVENNAGGYVFALDIWKRLDRFLILGADSNTYYQNAREITRENAKVVEMCWSADPGRTVRVIVDVSTAGRAPKNDPAIFALALGAVSANEDARASALMAVAKVCRTGTHLFQFVATAKALGKGFGRGMKRAVANWYLSRAADSLAYQVIKYRSRENLTHENLIDMSHPKTGDADLNSVLRWAIGKGGDSPRPALIAAHEAAMQTTTARELLPILAEHPSLPWEALPTWANADAAIQKALLPNMGMTAMIRNLGNLTRIGAIAPLSKEVDIIVDRLSNIDEIKKSRVHPLQILTALKIYSQGRGNAYGGKAASTWAPVQTIVAALDKAFYTAFKNVTPSGKRFLIGLDVSGSMGGAMIGNMSMTARDAGAAMALVTMATEPKTYLHGFSGRFIPLAISPGMRLENAVAYTSRLPFESTDCSIPMEHAIEKNLDVDVFMVITDNETYAGRRHPVEALRDYRRKTGINAKLVVIGMTSTGFSIADPQDAGMLDVVGFDTAAPALISDFAKG